MTRRVVTYLSDEQYEAFKAVMEERDVDEATLLRWALGYYWREGMLSYKWPKNDPERGGKRDGAGRKRKIDA